MLDRRYALRGILERGEPVLPWAMLFPVLLDILHQIAEAFPCMMPCPCVMPSAEHPLNGGGTRTGRREPEERTPRVTGAPLLDGCRLMQAGVLHAPSDTRELVRGVRVVQQGQERSQYPMVCTRAEPLQPCASRQRQRASQGGWVVCAWRPALFRRAWRPPRGPNLRQEGDSACIRTHHECLGLPVVVRTPQAGQPLDPVWLSILGHKLRPLPPPAALLEPAAYGCCGHLAPVFGLERCREGGPAPPRAAPAIRPRGGFEEGTARA